MKYLEQLHRTATYFDAIGCWVMGEYIRGLIKAELAKGWDGK